METDKRKCEESPDDSRYPAVLAEKPIERLREIGQALGQAVPRRIINLYLGDAPSRLADLRESLLSGDAAGIESAAHSLRGSSANLGASLLADLCSEIENRCRGAVAPGTEERLVALEAEYGRVEEAMHELLAEFA